MTAGFWDGRRVLVTGHTGFKGAWLTEWLHLRGARVHGLSLAPKDPSLSRLLGRATSDIGDVRDLETVRATFASAQPDVVFHLAAQSFVLRGYAEPVVTYSTNVLGTVNVLEAARDIIPAAIVVVTSDKVYDPRASSPPFDESSPLGGMDPYSSSKAGAELVTAAYRSSYLANIGVAVATARAGNVIGGGDWGSDRIVPDFLRARELGEPLMLRHPDAIRPWQHVLDPLHGYLLLAEHLVLDPTDAPAVLNFGPPPDAGCTVAELIDRLRAGFGVAPVAKHDADEGKPHETEVLRLCSDLATETIGWTPRLDVDMATLWTANWHQAHERGDDPRALCRSQIEEFEGLDG